MKFSPEAYLAYLLRTLRITQCVVGRVRVLPESRLGPNKNIFDGFVIFERLISSDFLQLP